MLFITMLSLTYICARIETLVVVSLPNRVDDDRAKVGPFTSDLYSLD